MSKFNPSSTIEYIGKIKKNKAYLVWVYS
jgi:hypothetical protein